jgi:hypothetical protein
VIRHNLRSIRPRSFEPLPASRGRGPPHDCMRACVAAAQMMMDHLATRCEPPPTHPRQPRTARCRRGPGGRGNQDAHSRRYRMRRHVAVRFRKRTSMVIRRAAMTCPNSLQPLSQGEILPFREFGFWTSLYTKQCSSCWGSRGSSLISTTKIVDLWPHHILQGRRLEHCSP